MHEGHRQRLKARFLAEGFSTFEDHEILELLLYYTIPRSDTNPIAHRLLDKFVTLSSVFNASVDELCEVKGISEHSATFLKLVPHISRFYTELSVRNMTVINTSDDAGNYICGMIGRLTTEVFCVLCLDTQRKVIAFERLEHGTVSQSNIHPRKVLECALRHNASSVILAHNHPSGGLFASENDRNVTSKLCSVLEGVGISVIDHIISTSPNEYLSMSNSGIMPN